MTSNGFVCGLCRYIVQRPLFLVKTLLANLIHLPCFTLKLGASSLQLIGVIAYVNGITYLLLLFSNFFSLLSSLLLFLSSPIGD